MYLSEDLSEFNVITWAMSPDLRVYDESTDDLAIVEPTNDRFFEASIQEYNASGEPKPSSSPFDFKMYVDGETFAPINELPSDEYSSEDLRENGLGSIKDLTQESEREREIQPDGINIYTAVFDVVGNPPQVTIDITDALETNPDQRQYAYMSRE